MTPEQEREAGSHRWGTSTLNGLPVCMDCGSYSARQSCIGELNSRGEHRKRGYEHDENWWLTTVIASGQHLKGE